MKKIFVIVIVAVVVVLGGIVLQKNTSIPNVANTNENAASQEDSKAPQQNVGIKATRPMTGPESFGLSVCEEVPKATVASVIGKEIVETKDHSDSQTTGCTYVVNQQTMDNIVIVVAYLDPNLQKKFYESSGKEIKVLPEIPMDHFSIWDKDQIGGIYLLMADKKYVRVERSNPKVISNQEEIALAKQVAEIIQTGKNNQTN